MLVPLRLVVAMRALAFRAEAGTAEDDWLSFPSRHGAVLVHRHCVHHIKESFHVEPDSSGGDILARGDTLDALPPCPHAPRWLSMTSEAATGRAVGVSYYSDWVGYAVTTGNFGFMSSDWVVPAAPKSTGPVPGISSVYFFNGLEDGGGVHGKSSYVLQPVLTYGKSGCVIDPLHFFQWHFVSFSVTGSGRAYCGKRLSVKEGERIRGIMKLEDDKKTWTTLSIRLSNNETSMQSTNLGDKQPNAAYLTLEAMINYNCQTFPPGGAVTFESNILKDRAGKRIYPSWQKLLRHTECKQQVEFGSDGAVTIAWDSTLLKSDIQV